MLVENGIYSRCDKEDIIDGVVFIPKGVTKIGKFVFQKRDDVYKVILPEEINEIGYFSFYECKNLTEINLPDSIKKLVLVLFRIAKS